jgi:hypothetical protein
MADGASGGTRNAQSGNFTFDNDTDGNRSENDAAASGSSGDGGTVDPGSVATDSGSDTDSGTGERRRRGRKPGSRNKSKEDKIAIGDLAANIAAIHAAASVVFSTPELVLSTDPVDEPRKFADAIASVAAYYGWEKYLKYPNHPLVVLALTAGAIYWPRVAAIKMRHMAEHAEAQRNRPQPQRQGLAPPPARTEAPQPRAPEAPPSPAAPMGMPVGARATAAPTPQTTGPVKVTAKPIAGFENGPPLEIDITPKGPMH